MTLESVTPPIWDTSVGWSPEPQHLRPAGNIVGFCFKQTEAEYGTTESIVLESFLEDLVMCIPLTPHADNGFHLQFGAPNTGFNRIKEGALKTVVMLRLHTQGT